MKSKRYFLQSELFRPCRHSTRPFALIKKSYKNKILTFRIQNVLKENEFNYYMRKKVWSLQQHILKDYIWTYNNIERLFSKYNYYTKQCIH